MSCGSPSPFAERGSGGEVHIPKNRCRHVRDDTRCQRNQRPDAAIRPARSTTARVMRFCRMCRMLARAVLCLVVMFVLAVMFLAAALVLGVTVCDRPVVIVLYQLAMPFHVRNPSPERPAYSA